MFDQYGTVVDIQGGLVEYATPFLQAKGWTGSPNAFVTWWRRTHFENAMIDALLGRDHTSYRAIGEAAVAHVMDRAGIAYTEAEMRDLVAAIERLRPFPEVPPALERLRGRFRLVVLSNGDPDMLETAKRYHGIAFDQVISVAEAGAFKPHHATYAKAAELAGSHRTRCCSWRTTRSTASGRRRRGCARRSSTAAAGRLARRRISRT